MYRATCIVNDGFGWVEVVLFRDRMFIGSDSYNNILSHICQAKCHVCQTIIKCGLTNCQIKQSLVLEIGSCFGKFQYNIQHSWLTFNRNFFLRSTKVNHKEMHDNPPWVTTHKICYGTLYIWHVRSLANSVHNYKYVQTCMQVCTYTHMYIGMRIPYTAFQQMLVNTHPQI